VSADRDIAQWLEEQGYGLPAARTAARAALEEAGLTRPGKQRISELKVARAGEELRRRFVLHCESATCAQAARATGRAPLPAGNKTTCQICGGSDNRLAAERFVTACRARGVSRVVVVGGSPAVREELARSVTGLELRMVDGTERRTGDRARGDMEWADLVLIWGASELHHKVSELYTQAPPPARRKLVHVAKRGIAALLGEAIAHLADRR
jgi:hypothetical protein